MAAIEIENLVVEFPSSQGLLRAVDGVSFKVEQGEVLGIVGESGSGKSVAMLAAMGLVPYPGIVRADRLDVEGRNILTLSDAQRRKIVGKDMAMIFQEPATSLNPCYTVGFQIMEALRLHEKMDRKAARKRSVELLEQVGIPAPETRLEAYPHQLSGGMNQRVMIAMAIACNPKLLIADEPTTALDVTIQAQILDLLMSLQRERGMALILITHNMGVVSETAQRVAVMYSGQVMEQNATDRLFADPQHPYTAALMAARPENRIGDKLATIPGTVPSLYERPSGCLFAPRCQYATPHCFADRPDLRAWSGGAVRCHYPLGDAERDAKIAADRASISKPAGAAA
ncbi:ABC transporter ATP-binding protein [Undibacter mobilis]|uniref:ABC transporter ATP-binding protein n=1 Tax=Undibacter mobilis TaxID=2292256 RepID=A0A371B9U4_9BRAD|nr:ABC transporter ATP-binding protein [Undibacter mobilis]RDV04131.1 ABC transporter ATP-binding protein [Undibacter mobilis]